MISKEDIIEILNVVSDWYQNDVTVKNPKVTQAIEYFDDIIDYIKNEKFYWRIPLVDDQYLNYSIEDDTYICSTKHRSQGFETIFTEAEIKDIERRHNVDLSFLQKELVEDED